MHALDYTPQKKTENSLKTEKSRPQKHNAHENVNHKEADESLKECRVCFCLANNNNNKNT